MISFWIATIHLTFFLIFAGHNWLMKKKDQTRAKYSFLPNIDMQKTSTVLMVFALCTGAILASSVILGL